jgi:hypothetical protein
MKQLALKEIEGIGIYGMINMQYYVVKKINDTKNKDFIILIGYCKYNLSSTANKTRNH